MNRRKLILILSSFLCTIHAGAQKPGALDIQFARQGVFTFPAEQSAANAVNLHSGQKILVAGYVQHPSTGKDALVMRLHPNGTLDSSFGVNGYFTMDVQAGSDDEIMSMAVQSNGKIVLGGYSDNGSDGKGLLIRLTSNGNIDQTFGNQGIVLSDFESRQRDEFHVVRIHQASGKIVAGGQSIISSNSSKPVIARYDTLGSPDSTFNSVGHRLLWVTGLDYQYLFGLEDLIVHSNGMISASGWRDFPGLSWSSDYWVCRLLSDGTMDAQFSSDGVNTYNGSFNGHDRAYAMLFNANNELMIAGGGYTDNLRYRMTLFKLTTQGAVSTPNASFGFGTLRNDIASAVAADSKNRILLAGTSSGADDAVFAITRILSNGTEDTTFGNLGKVTTRVNQASYSRCNDMIVQLDGKILAVGTAGNQLVVVRYEDKVVLDTLTLISPSNLATGRNFASHTFTWSASEYPTEYELQIQSTPNFSATPGGIITSVPNYTSVSLLPGRTYYWRVRAVDGTREGPFSEVYSFSTRSLNDFRLISPADQSVSKSHFVWSWIPGLEMYELELDTQPDFPSAQNYSANDTSYFWPNLPENTKFYWRVRAKYFFESGDWSEIRSFTTPEDSIIGIMPTIISEVKLYPIPATHHLYIDHPYTYIKNYSIQDVRGNLIIVGRLENNQKYIDISDLQTGMYVLNIGEDVRIQLPVFRTGE